MRRLAIIPARGGSKRIPRKNIRNFLGQPIIAYSIQAAIGCGLFSEVLVSTDDEEIASVAKDYGASVPFLRSKGSSNDHATTVDVLREVHATLEYLYTEACCIYATAPLITSSLLQEALSVMELQSHDSVFPVVPFSYPIQRALLLTSSKQIKLADDAYRNARSQDLPLRYHDAGMFYWYRPTPILAANSLFTENSGCIIVEELQAHDIDTEIDWNLAEMKYRLLIHE